jgi:KEOPS complex subunit Pcc1
MEINAQIAIEMDNSSQAKIVYDAIILEFATAPDYRSEMLVQLKDSAILININAKDSTSFRASINSSIKWIKLSLEINKLI